MKKKCSANMILYELRNLNGNLLPHFFGIIFPNVMSLLLSRAVGGQVPETQRGEVVTSMMLSMSLVMPMSIMFLGYGCLYATEVEKEIPLRMRLFGYSRGCEVRAKIAAHLILLTIAFVIFAVFHAAVMHVQKPAAASLLGLVISLYAMGVIFLVIAHSIASILRKFSLTFGVIFFLYFVIMLLTGMFGIRTEQLPGPLQAAAKLLPMTYISNDFAGFWQGGSYNFMPFLQAFLFMGAAAGILLLLTQRKKGSGAA